MTVVFGLGTRLRVRMRTTLENGVLRNEQLSGSTVNNIFDQGNFETMKTLSGWEALRCDEHQFRAKIKVSRGSDQSSDTRSYRTVQLLSR